jgi:dTDP-4-amino-4,6-dideoxygalactose transaminase
VHLHAALRSLGVPGVGAFPIAEAWAAEELSLRTSPYLDAGTVEHVARLVNESLELEIHRPREGAST